MAVTDCSLCKVLGQPCHMHIPHRPQFAADVVPILVRYPTRHRSTGEEFGRELGRAGREVGETFGRVTWWFVRDFLRAGPTYWVVAALIVTAPPSVTG